MDVFLTYILPALVGVAIVAFILWLGSARRFANYTEP